MVQSCSPRSRCIAATSTKGQVGLCPPGLAILRGIPTFVALAILSVTLSSCAGISTGGDRTATAYRVVVTPPTVVIAAGQNQQFSAVAEDANGHIIAGVSFTWSSDATAIATVNATGLASGQSQGTAHISAAASNGVSGSATLSVQTAVPVVASVIVSPATASITTGQGQQFSAVAEDANGHIIAGVSFTWSSDATAIATVNANGLASGQSQGTAHISAAASNGVSGSATLSVQAPPLVIPTQTLGVAELGKAYSQTLVASGGVPPYGWAVTVGNLPAGIQVSASSGVVSGTADQSGQFSFTVEVTDSSLPEQKVSVNLGMTVEVVPDSLGVPESFFGVHVNESISPWPTIFGFNFGGFRSLASQVNWSDINTADGVYNWTKFDSWMAKAFAGGQDVLYTIYSTPAWASSNPTDICTGYAPDIGGCDAPNDLNPDGSGSNQHFQDFVKALMSHVGPGKIRYVEVWNEPNITTEWAGTQAQMLRMASDAYTLVKLADPDALVLSPPVSYDMALRNWMKPYLQAGGGQYADIIGVHGYVSIPGVSCPNNCPVPENVGKTLDDARALMVANGQQNKPLFDTEGSWGITAHVTDPDIQVAFTGRYYLIQLAGTATSKGFDRFYWYGWDIKSGEMFYNTSESEVTVVGIAYQQIYDWTIGSTLSPCIANGTRWTCGVTRSGEYQALAIWDTSQSCGNGVCSTVDVTVDPTFVQYRDLAGNLTPISGNTVPVGSKPILLENRSSAYESRALD